MAAPLAIFWDEHPDGNVAHLAEHGVGPKEAEQVIGRYFAQREPSRSTPAYEVVEGFTDAGRFLVVVFEYLTDEDIAIPVTAFEPEENQP